MRPIIAALLLSVSPALSHECDKGVTSCKVITLSPNEEQILIQPNGILDTAAKARYIDMFELTNYFRDKLNKAPAGEPSKGDAAVPTPKVEDKKK